MVPIISSDRYISEFSPLPSYRETVRSINHSSKFDPVRLLLFNPRDESKTFKKRSLNHIYPVFARVSTEWTCRLDRTTTGRARVSMRSPYVTLSHASHTYGRAVTCSSSHRVCRRPSTRCPDMAAAPDRRLSYLAPRVLDAHPVYTVSRDVSHDALTRRSPVHCVGILRARAFIVRGSPRGALHN